MKLRESHARRLGALTTGTRKRAGEALAIAALDSAFAVLPNMDAAWARPSLSAGSDMNSSDQPEMQAAEEHRLIAAALDVTFYRRQCHDLNLPAEADPVEHYIERGWRAGLDPTPDFATTFYLSRSADVRACGMNPFYHFLKWGRLEGRVPNPLGLDRDDQNETKDLVGAEFDRDFYLRNHPELVDNHVDPVLHYLAFGWEMGWDPQPAFSTLFYLERSPDVRAAGVNPFQHYLSFGRHEGRTAAPEAPALPYSKVAMTLRPEFDAAFYGRSYPQLECATNHVDPLLHYLHFGWRMGFDPSPDFSTRFYLDRSPDVRASDENPLAHYVRTGRAQGRLPLPPIGFEHADDADYLDGEQVRARLAGVFDARFYKAEYSDIRLHQLDALQHFLSAGWREGRDPAPWFSTANYLARYPGVSSMRMNPLLHYVVWGKAQGFTPYQGDRSEARVKVVAGAELVAASDLRALLNTAAEPDPLIDAAGGPALDPARLCIHWVVPDFNVGGGGHMTIFRMVKWLELFGHECTIWVHGASDRTDTEREDILLRHYQVVRARVHTLPPEPRFDGADALIATGWDTAYLVRASPGARARFYFVQDYEPYFYPVGARSLAASRTYTFGLTCVCASPWLERRMREHGCEAHAFALAADEAYVAPATRVHNLVPRIAFYARDYTTRRAVELGLLALEILAQRGERFHVDIFGTDTRFEEAPFPATNWGIIDPAVLSRLYGEADLGVCFSTTNYSLVPQEMMACGLPVVELDTESTREAFPAGVAAMAQPDPHDIADRISGLLHDEVGRRALAARGLAWARSLSWEHSARRVESILLQRLGVPPPAPKGKFLRKRPTQAVPRVTVVIPTFNGGELFHRVLDAVLNQRTPWPFDLMAVDSSSTDGTWEHLCEQSELHAGRLRTQRIAKSDFQHGRTRNLAATVGTSEYIAFLTQDALPVDASWLANMVIMLERFPRAAGAFGRHLAWPDATPFTRFAIDNHFAGFDRQPFLVSKYTDLDRWRRGDLAYRRFLHFYSDNNSCLRRSVWERHPYPEIDYGEDQLWAHQIVTAGYAKLYAQKAVVYHSHNYDEMQTFERARTEAAFFSTSFGYNVAPNDPQEAIRRMNADDEKWGVRHGATAEQIDYKKRLNIHKVFGLAAGATEGITFPSAF